MATPCWVSGNGAGLAVALWGWAARQRSSELAREAGAGGRRGGQGQTAPTSQFPCESTILLSRIMDSKMPRKAERAIRWVALLLLTTASFPARREEINQTTSTTSESLGSIRRREINTYIINPKLKGSGTWGQAMLLFFRV